MERIGLFATAGDHPKNVRAARPRMLQRFQHQRAGAFGHHEAVASLGERT